MIVGSGNAFATTAPNKALYLTTKAQIQPFTTNWRHNRPADDVRIRDIATHYNEANKSWIDHIIYTWKNGDRLLVYDGWNRFHAAAPHMKLILSIFETENEGDVIEDFRVLNKSVPIPDIYDGTANQKQELLTSVCERFDELYGAFKKPSRNPRCPHYNRDMVMQLLSDLPVPFELLTAAKMIDAITKANNELGRYPINVPAKAKEHHFYLFASKTVNSAQVITKHLQEEKTIGSRILNMFK